MELLANNLDVPIETVKAALSRPSGARRPRQPAHQRTSAAVASPFAKLDHDPVEEHCLQLLLEFPELRELASGLKAEFFQRHENKELFTRWLNADCGMDKEKTLAAVRRDGNDEVSGQLTMLFEKTMIQSNVSRRNADILETVSRLEERSLRNLKTEEAKRFAETPPDLEGGENDGVLQLNEQIKKNEGFRRGQSQEISA